jgi:antitoxin MazE
MLSRLTDPRKPGNYIVITRKGGGMGSIKVSIVKIGNSRGIRIPKALLEQTRLDGELELVPDGNQLILRSLSRPREGWDETFKSMAEWGDDSLLDEGTVDRFEEEDWEW